VTAGPKRRGAAAQTFLEGAADSGRWALAIRASGQPAHPFIAFDWLTMAARLTGTTFVPLIVRVDGVDVGVVPWLERRFGPFRTVNALPFPYAGPLVPPRHLAGTLEALRRRARGHVAVREEFGLAPTTVFDRTDLTVAGHTVLVSETYVIDSSRSLDELAGGLTAACRKSLRKAERDNVVISTDHDGATLGRVVQNAYSARSQDTGYDLRRLAPTDVAASGVDFHWTVARQPDGTELGSLLTVATAETAFLWLGGVLPEHRSSRGNVLLHWDAIRWAQQRGIASVDMIGVPDAGIGRFKSQFGGVLHSYPRLQRTAPGLTAARASVQRVKSLRFRQGTARSHAG
jgi:hypothetical protein